MEARNRKLPLRILYTVSGSQYILARSSSSVPVLLVPHTHTGFDHSPVEQTRPEFGTASLKTCLDAICISSPELVQDKRRDFSVYVLDPLESNSAPAQVNIPNAAPQSSDSRSAPEQPRGLAVALGLMSWALMLDESDSTPVTGTVIKLPTGQEALEIIFALKETVAMEKSSLPAALRTWGLPPGPTNSPSGTAANASVADIGRSTGSSERYSAHHTHRSISHSTEASSSTSTPSSSHLGHVPTDSATLATIASIRMRSQHKRAKAKVKKPAKTLSIDPENSEADRLLMSHYVGPERKKAGRPPNAVASGSKSNKSVRTQAPLSAAVDPTRTASSSSTAIPPISSTAHQSQPESNDAKSHAKSSKDPLTNPFTSAPLTRSPRDPEPQTLLDILAFLSSSSSSSDPNVQNTALLAALSAIDSNQAKGPTGSEKPPSPLLVNALRELISAAAQRQTIPQSAPNNNGAHPPLNNTNRHHLPDDDVVLLDKENVNPTVFRRRSEREGKACNSDASTPVGSGVIFTSEQSNTETPTARGLNARSNGNINTIPVTSASVSASSPPPSNYSSSSRRKRTLSDFMDEREASKEKEKMREREWVDRRDTHRHARSSPRRNEFSSIRYYPRLVSDVTQPIKRASGSYYRTAEGRSPPKPGNERHKWNENSSNGSPGFLKVSASSPIRSTTTTTKFRKPYVVPAWARTSTSMQPRLSEEAARALELVESKKKEERKARKRGTLRTEKEKKKKRVQSPSPSPSDVASRQRGSTPSALCPPPVTVTSDGPTFALTSVIQDRIAAFSSPVSSEPRSPRPDKPALPCTPPRKRNSDLFSPGEDGSLFTPVPGRRFSNMQTPVGFGSAKKPSPKTPKTSKKTTEDGNEASGEESEDELEDALNLELDNALDELDMPSSSLPSVSSDVEMETQTTLRSRVIVRSENFEDTDAETSKKQHWIGLPPSSPPPPTSPLILPQDDDESDDTMLPAVTSDADLCPTDSEGRTDSMYTESSACTDEELAEYLESDFASIFAPVQQPTFGNDPTQSNMNLFDQFTDHKVQSDGPEQNTILDPNFDALQEGLVDFDLAEFWETFKPLLQDQNGSVAGDSVNTVSGHIAENQVFDPMNYDHMKLAEDVQALFSGCVV